MSLLSVLAVCASALPCAGSPSLLTTPAIVQQELVNEAYRLRIAPDDDSISVLGRAEAQGLNRAAIAGVRSGQGVWAAILPEFAPGQDLDVYVEVVSDNIGLSPDSENARMGEVESLEHHGQPARQRTCDVRVNDIEIRYLFRVYSKGDYVFQIVAWGPRELIEEGQLTGAAELFEVLPGEVVGSRGRVDLLDEDGVGWRQRAGVWESALVGARLEPRGPWRVVVGFELEGMSDAADVGLLAVEPDTYCTITVYRQPVEDAATTVAEMLEFWSLESGAEPAGEPVEMELAGGRITLTPYLQGGAMGTRVLHGALVVDGAIVEVEAWCTPSLAEEAFGALPEGLAGFQLLDEVPHARLEAELLAAPDPEVAYGEGFSLRKGAYTDFTHGFRLTKPPGFWDFGVGARARVAGPNVRVRAVLCEQSLVAHLEATGWRGDDLVDAHVSSLVHEWHAFEEGEELPEPRRVEFAGTEFLVTDVVAPGEVDELGRPFVRLRVATALRDGRRYELSFEAPGVGVQAHGADVDAFTGALAFGVAPAVEAGEETYLDRRVGFSVRRPGDDWDSQQLELPGPVSVLGSAHTWDGPGSRSLTVLGIGFDDTTDGGPMVRAILDGMAGNMGGRITRSEGTFLGEKVEVLESSRLLAKGSFAVVMRRGRAVIIGCTGPRSDDLLALAEQYVTIDE